MERLCHKARFATALPILLCFSTPVWAHEAWLLTPAEIVELSRAPLPPLFRSQLWLGMAAAAAFALTLVALRLEPVIADIEERFIAPVWRNFSDLGPLLVRLGVAVMLVLGAFGGLPRHGTDVWSTPTFMVPDMQLSNVAGADTLILLQVTLGLLLIAGLATRACGIAVIGLSLAGPVIFGLGFLSYTLHFAAPGLILIALGAGRFSCDYHFDMNGFDRIIARYRQILWRLSQILIGVGFVYLGLAYKLTQPTLLIAILEHAEMPTLGLPMPVIALIMTGVEILCGALLITGRLVRPVALAILGAITFLAVVLGETPLFHANLYGALSVIFLAGRSVPQADRRAQIQMARAA